MGTEGIPSSYIGADKAVNLLPDISAILVDSWKFNSRCFPWELLRWQTQECVSQIDSCHHISTGHGTSPILAGTLLVSLSSPEECSPQKVISVILWRRTIQLFEEGRILFFYRYNPNFKSISLSTWKSKITYKGYIEFFFFFPSFLRLFLPPSLSSFLPSLPLYLFLSFLLFFLLSDQMAQWPQDYASLPKVNKEVLKGWLDISFQNI